jgi:hypothetical protein
MSKDVNEMSNQLNDELIMATIEKSLSAIGERPKQVLWFCLEQDLKIDRKKVPENLETFQQELQRFFGLGYNFLTALFLRNLGDAIGEDLSGYSNFADCVKSLRLRLESTTENKNIPTN